MFECNWEKGKKVKTKFEIILIIMSENRINCEMECEKILNYHILQVSFLLTICCCFLNQRCSSGDDCAQNFCCPVIVQRCLPKILENGACNFNVSTSLGTMLAIFEATVESTFCCSLRK